jgi:hypothetical protein
MATQIGNQTVTRSSENVMGFELALELVRPRNSRPIFSNR